MKDSIEALRLSLKYRWSILGAFLSSLMIAFLFGASITTVLPFVKVVFSEKDNTIESWVQANVDSAQLKVTNIQTAIANKNQASGSEIKLDSYKPFLEAKDNLEFQKWVQSLVAGRVPTTAYGTLQLVMAWLLFACILKGIFFVLSMVLVSRIANRTVMDMQRIYYRKALAMDVRRMEGFGTSSMLTYMSANMQLVGAALMSLYGKAIREPLKMLTCLIGAAFISIPLLVMSLIVIPLGLLFVRVLSKKMKKAVTNEMGGLTAIFQTLMETFNEIKTVKIFNREQTERVRFKKEAKTVYKISQRIAFYDALIRPVSEVVGILSFSIAVMIGGYLVFSHQTSLLGISFRSQALTPEEMVMFFIFLAGASDPARKLSEITNTLVRGSHACKMLSQAFDPNYSEKTSMESVPTPVHSKNIEFDGVYFTYHNNIPVLENICMDIPFGQTVAIVGGNGCGKSTIASLLPRFYRPTVGTIRIDGVDIHEMDARQLRQQFSWVSQDAFLFRGSIYENIGYGNKNAKEEEILEAARLAGVTDFLDELIAGIQTDVGDMGSNLSGGQRQRVALARAIVAEPRILILDEATSAMDGQNETLIHQRLTPYIKKRTTIIISHKISAMEIADRILLMEAGRIIQDGTLENMKNSSEHFSQLFKNAA